MRVMMQKTVFIVFLDGFHFSAGWSSSPARCCSACGNTRSWGRSTGSQVKFLWEIHPGVKILTWILSRVEGGGLCDENRCCSKCSAKLPDASQLNPQQADGKPGRNEVGWKQKKRVKDDTNGIKVDLVIMVPHSRYEDRTLARGGQQQQNNSHATNGAAAYSVEMPTITNCSNQRNMFFLQFQHFLLFQADSVPMESLSLYSGAGRGGTASGASIYPPGQHMVRIWVLNSIYPEGQHMVKICSAFMWFWNSPSDFLSCFSITITMAIVNTITITSAEKSCFASTITNNKFTINAPQANCTYGNQDIVPVTWVLFSWRYQMPDITRKLLGLFWEAEAS